MKNPEPGNFAGVVMEMVKVFRKENIDRCESKVLWFLIGELQGNLCLERLLEMKNFREGTEMPKQRIDEAIKRLIKKKIIERQSTEVLGHYWYNFNKRTFGRVHGVKTIKQDVKGLRLIEGGKGKKLSTKHKNGTLCGHGSSDPKCEMGHGSSDPTVTEVVTHSCSKSRQSLSRDTFVSFQRQKELDAHEERKRSYAKKGSQDFSDLIDRCKKGFLQ